MTSTGSLARLKCSCCCSPAIHNMSLKSLRCCFAAPSITITHVLHILLNRNTCYCTKFWQKKTRKDYTIGTLHYNWISLIEWVCACVTGLQHVQCTENQCPKPIMTKVCQNACPWEFWRVDRGDRANSRVQLQVCLTYIITGQWRLNFTNRRHFRISVQWKNIAGVLASACDVQKAQHSLDNSH